MGLRRVFGPDSLQVALNGSREHPATPRTPEQIAVDAFAVYEAGVRLVHFHPFDANGDETLHAAPCAAAIAAVREKCPDILISLSTSAAIETDPARRVATIQTWDTQPDFVTANMGEPGTVELCSVLVERGIGIEAGLLSVDDARRFVTSGIAHLCKRVLVEPLDADPLAACRHASEIEHVLTAGGVTLAQVHHGQGVASWYVNMRARFRSHGIRTGLEDTAVLPNGHTAAGNAELVAHAVSMMTLV